MTFNTELADRIMDVVRMTPERWDQRTWANETACGTTHCVAGWAVALTARERGVSEETVLRETRGRPYGYTVTELLQHFDAETSMDYLYELRGAELLGLTPHGSRADALFTRTIVEEDDFALLGRGPNALHAVETLVKAYANEPEGDAVPPVAEWKP